MRAGRIEQIDTPQAIYDRPLNRFVAGFVGHANLWDGTVTAPDSVTTPLGTLRNARQPRAAGRRVAVLVRPEHVQLGAGPDGSNRFTGAVARDRFLGAQRRFDFAVAGGTLVGVTASREPIAAVHVAPEHVILLDAETSPHPT